ncbi:hypothetical protein ATANTOWER_003842 [Ataeniobius toweri]|uniref:Uncharacterized protein n=1 Tax=Ataeniobius toweri TaxID=208326 RepID=A0ABU7A4Y3_9TELE|nr:hypothetical protein [Ataeniobius toweri]
MDIPSEEKVYGQFLAQKQQGYLSSARKLLQSEAFPQSTGEDTAPNKTGDLEVHAGKMRRSLDINHYATKKSAAQSMLDVALLMANSSQLKTISSHKYLHHCTRLSGGFNRRSTCRIL